jgi:methylmalonyl-CoA mutase N-terminal domain/subunit
MSTEKKNNSGLPIDVVYGPNETKSTASEQPGQFPYTRGVKADMYRGRLWTMRQYAGSLPPKHQTKDITTCSTKELLDFP